MEHAAARPVCALLGEGHPGGGGGGWRLAAASADAEGGGALHTAPDGLLLLPPSLRLEACRVLS